MTKSNILSGLGGQKVVLISHGFQTNYERGFSNGVATLGCQVLLLSSDRTDYQGLSEEINTINIRGSQDEGRSSLSKLLNLARYHLLLWLQVVQRRGALFHVMGLNSPPVLCGVLEGLLYRLFGSKYILTVHNLLPHDRHTTWNSVVNRLVYAIPSMLVVHTDLLRTKLIDQYHLAPERIVVMEHGIEPFSVDIPEQTSKGKDVVKLLFFGKIAKYKGLEDLLEAIKDVKFNFHLTIAGCCDSEAMKTLMLAKLETHPRQNSISWKDEFVPENDVRGLFESNSLLVLPYRHIDQSGVLFQALRYGLPIVATRVGQFDSYINSDVGIVCEPSSPESLKAALTAVVERLPTLGRKRIQEIGKSYEWQLTVKALLPVYGRMAAKRSDLSIRS